MPTEQSETPRDPHTVGIYRTVMEWLEGIRNRGFAHGPLGPALRIPLYPRFGAYAPTADLDLSRMVMRSLCFIWGTDDLGLYAESTGESRRRVYYHPNWRAVADIEAILREEDA